MALVKSNGVYLVAVTTGMTATETREDRGQWSGSNDGFLKRNEG